MHMNIAIDGPAGAGKSTIAKAVARELGYIYVDTGAMYRAMALYMIQQNIGEENWEAQAFTAESADITIRFIDGTQHVILNGQDVSDVIRTSEVSHMASVTSANPAIREKLVALQQKLAASESVVMDGRDIGTVVLPEAQVKIYLTASSAERARRRYKEMEEKGTLGSETLASIEEGIIERDYRDSHREHSPLRQAEDAVYLDSSDLTIEEVIARILSIISEKGEAL
ncbi:MAG: (d)CMP kinase [Lachnospiraceae bacterium]|nr:(d)CMP kinase [Candidatus Equihabitans merdae]